MHTRQKWSTWIQTAWCMFSALYTRKRSASIIDWKSIMDIVCANCKFNYKIRSLPSPIPLFFIKNWSRVHTHYDVLKSGVFTEGNNSNVFLNITKQAFSRIKLVTICWRINDDHLHQSLALHITNIPTATIFLPAKLQPQYSHEISDRLIQGGSNMTGTDAACLHTNQSWSYLNHLVLLILGRIIPVMFYIIRITADSVKYN